MTLNKVTPETAKQFAQNVYTNATVWTTRINVSTFLKGNIDITY